MMFQITEQLNSDVTNYYNSTSVGSSPVRAGSVQMILPLTANSTLTILTLITRVQRIQERGSVL